MKLCVAVYRPRRRRGLGSPSTTTATTCSLPANLPHGCVHCSRSARIAPAHQWRTRALWFPSPLRGDAGALDTIARPSTGCDRAVWPQVMGVLRYDVSTEPLLDVVAHEAQRTFRDRCAGGVGRVGCARFVCERQLKRSSCAPSQEGARTRHAAACARACMRGVCVLPVHRPFHTNALLALFCPLPNAGLWTRRARRSSTRSWLRCSPARGSTAWRRWRVREPSLRALAVGRTYLLRSALRTGRPGKVAFVNAT